MTTEDKEREVAEALENMTKGKNDSPKAGDTDTVTKKVGGRRRHQKNMKITLRLTRRSRWSKEEVNLQKNQS